MTLLARHFSATYREARERFRTLAKAHHARLEAHPIAAADRTGRPLDLTIDVAALGPTQPRTLLIVSSGLHGGEGFFGSAVQLAWLERYRPADAGVLMWHALNPFGFDQLRRANESNIDLNRNFRLPGEPFTGSPPGAAALQALLAPAGPPQPFDLFSARLWLRQARMGGPALRAAVAGGQYEFPRGLFYGGTEPAATHRLLASELPRWVGSAERVVHVDFHTGLGPFGSHKLLVSRPADTPYVARLRRQYGDAVVEAFDPASSPYPTAGAIDDWLENRLTDRDAVSLCAEFGTYGPLRVLATLRNENRAHFACPPDDPRDRAAKVAMRETFAPASAAWRERVVGDACGILDRAMAALAAPRNRG